MKPFILKIVLFSLTVSTLLCLNFVKAQNPEKMVLYHENGQVKVESYFDTNDKPIGIWNYYHENGKLARTGRMKTGSNELVVETGAWKTYYASGELESEGNFKAGFREGLWKYYNKNGTLLTSGEHGGFGGLPQGIWKTYSENGQIESQGKYNGDVERDGEWMFYYPNGTIAIKGDFIDGEMDGVWKFYHENGTLKNMKYYEDGMVSNVVKSDLDIE